MINRSPSTLSVPATSAAKPHYDGDPNEIRKQIGTVGSSSFKIKPRGLNIVWGNDKRYWSIPEKDVNGPAELKQVCWLEVTAKIPLKELNAGKYNVSFDVRLKADAFGWDKLPIRIMAKIGKKGKYKWKTYTLAPDIVKNPDRKFHLSLDQPIEVTDEHLNDPNNDHSLYFGLYEVWRERWKGGLLIDEATIEPEATVTIELTPPVATQTSQ